jgi:hypothetical protein
MARKTTNDFIPVLRDVYFKGEYAPQSHYLAELNLLQTKRLSGLGGEQMLNDANTKKLIGISDFTGTQVPSDAQGIINALTVEYGQHATESNAALIDYSSLKASFPAWLLNSELVLKSKSVEQFRIRVSELVTNEKPQVVVSEWNKQLERALKVTSNQDLQLFLSTPDGAALESGLNHFIRVNLYGIKFAPRSI